MLKILIYHRLKFLDRIGMFDLCYGLLRSLLDSILPIVPLVNKCYVCFSCRVPEAKLGSKSDHSVGLARVAG